MYTRKEIIEALATIKTVCEKSSECPDCPFSSGYGCQITINSPSDWLLVDLDNEIWHAFK